MIIETKRERKYKKMRTDPKKLAIGYILDNLTEEEMDYVLNLMSATDKEIFVSEIKAHSPKRNKDPYEVNN